MKKNHIVFIDGSGNPGLKSNASSPIFMVAGILFADPDIVMRVNERIDSIRNVLKWKEQREFKFRKSAKRIRLFFLRNIASYDFEIYAVYIDKYKYSDIFEFSDNEKLYNWVIKELLRTMPLEDARIIIDGKYGKKYNQRVASYLKSNLNIGKKRIKKIRVQDSNRNNLVQAADMVVGSLARYMRTDKKDGADYFQIIKDKIVKIDQLDLRKK